MVLSVNNLTVKLPEGADREFAVRNVCFTLAKGEILCVVGESGSGKSVTANTIMGLLSDDVKPTSGEIEFQGRDLLRFNDEERRNMRGRDIAMIFQEPMTALNPLMRVEDQIAEVFEAHGLHSRQERRKAALLLVEEVGLPDAAKILRAYPFQLSGGQRQRVMIAMALALEPKILIADEPTTALDVTTQAQILDLVRKLQKERGMAVLFITHDIGVVAEIADRVVVMRSGQVVEEGRASEVIVDPKQSYTRKLIAAVPSLIPPEPRTIEQSEPILQVQGMTKTFITSGGMFKAKRTVHAANGISFELFKGETLGIVGESGSGKSTTGYCLARLEKPDAGRTMLHNRDWMALSNNELRSERRKIQMVFQDPYASLNPRYKISRILTDGPVANGENRSEVMSRAYELLDIVGLDKSAMDRFPHEFSGGQRQRIGIARALIMKPEVLIADEAVSALDVSVQAQVLDLLRDLRDRFDLSIIFITHDLCVAAQICDSLLVMKQGKIVERGPVNKLFRAPEHDYTQNLLGAVPGWGNESYLRESKGRV